MKKRQLLLLAILPLMICCKKQDNKTADSTLTFKNVVILGNSITYSPQNTAVGWYGNWGMAATAQDSDYVHILTRRFQAKSPGAQVNIKNIVPFEKDPVHYDFDAELKGLRDKKPDLLIIRIGENVPEATDMQLFDQRYTALVNYFKSANKSMVVLSGASVWSDNVDSVMMKHPPYVLLKSMLNNGANFSTGLFADPGVAGHPSNKGMQYIAALLWEKIETLTANDRK